MKSNTKISISLATITLLLLIWFVASSAISLNRYFLPDFTLTFQEFWRELLSGEILKNTTSTLTRALGGFLIAIVIGLPMGYFIGKSRLLSAALIPIFDFIRSVPTSMLFPLVILFFGIEEFGKWAIVVLGTSPMLIAVSAKAVGGSANNIDRKLYFQIRGKLLSTWLRILLEVLDVIPALVASSKIAISIALILVIVTEMFFTAQSGLGFAAHDAYLAFDMEKMYLQVFVVGIVGVLLNGCLDWLVKMVGAE